MKQILIFLSFFITLLIGFDVSCTLEKSKTSSFEIYKFLSALQFTPEFNLPAELIQAITHNAIDMEQKLSIINSLGNICITIFTRCENKSALRQTCTYFNSIGINRYSSAINNYF